MVPAALLLLCAIAPAVELDRGVLVQIGASQFHDQQRYPVSGAFEIGFHSRRWRPGRPLSYGFEAAFGLDSQSGFLMAVTPLGHMAWGIGTAPSAGVRAEVTLGVGLFIVIPLPEVGFRLAVPEQTREDGSYFEPAVFGRMLGFPTRDTQGWMVNTRWFVGLDMTIGRSSTRY